MTTLVEVADPSEIPGAYLADERPPRSARPWFSLGMVASVDGATSLDGRSAGLGGAPDLQAFRAMRAVSDVVIVGAGTVRAERYRGVRLPDELRSWRVDFGKPPVPRLAVVTQSLELDPSPELIESHPIVLTSRSADPARRSEVAEWAEVIDAGGDGVDPQEVGSVLRRSGVAVAHVEGGPRLNGLLLAGGVVDEIAMTIAPTVVIGDSPRIVIGEDSHLRDARLDRVISSHDHLLLRYLL